MELSECFELCMAVLNQSDKCFNTAFNSFLIKIFRVIKPQYLPEALLKYVSQRDAHGSTGKIELTRLLP